MIVREVALANLKVKLACGDKSELGFLHQTALKSCQVSHDIHSLHVVVPYQMFASPSAACMDFTLVTMDNVLEYKMLLKGTTRNFSVGEFIS